MEKEPKIKKTKITRKVRVGKGSCAICIWVNRGLAKHVNPLKKFKGT